MSIAPLEAPLCSPAPAPAAPPFAAFSHCSLLPTRVDNSIALPSKGSNALCRSLSSWGCWKSSDSRKRPDRCLRANVDSDGVVGSGDTEDAPARATVEQGKRILALQKDLLDQIAERKKLVTAIKEKLASPTEQIKAYNDGENREATQEEGPPSQSLSSQRSPSKSTLMDMRAPLAASPQPYSSVKAPKLEDVETGNMSTTLRTRFEDYLSPVQAPSPSSPPSLRRIEDVLRPDTEKKASQSMDNKSGGDQLPSEETIEAAGEGTFEEPLAGPNVMNVILVAAECAPWSKTGGLGDVAGALPKALARRGHRVMVVVPRYAIYEDAWETGVRKRYNVAGQDLEVGYFHAYIDGVDHVFIDSPIFSGFGNNIYGGKREDVLKRMVLFCKAAVEVPWHVPCGGVCYGDGNLCFIANDWHTALLPVYLQAYYRENGLMQYTRSVLVIHNMAHQGRGPLSDYSYLGLPDHYLEKFRLYDPVGGEHMNIFMAGLLTAHRIVAVSHGYAWECQTQEGGWGLDGVVRENNWKLRGIVNGIDDKEWSPELDTHLKSDGYTNYSLNTLESGKAQCKAALQRELGLPVRSDVPLLGFIGRLDHQKGVDIIADAMQWMTEQDLQLVMLGSGRDDLENLLRTFEGKYRDKVRGWVGFSVKTAHRITAGCDILLMPSRFEPCGLNQLYAMRYGTIPVVHAVGGLRDTVCTFDPYSNTGTGWTFDRADPAAMISALGNAMWTYRDFKDSWKAIQRRGMSQDLSWDNAAKQYEEVMVAAKYQW